MLPLITPKALADIPFDSRLANTSHMAEARKSIEEADDADRRAKVGQFAFRLDDALDDVQHRLDQLGREAQGDQEVQKIVRAFQQKFYAARREATKLLRY